MSETILHVGPHKTGSTLIQNYFTLNQAEIETLGTGVVLHDNTNGSAFLDAMIRMRSAEKSLFSKISREALNGFAELVADKTQPRIIVSHEDILGHPSSAGFYCRDHARGAILRTLSKMKPLIVLVVRPQHELLESYYRHSIMMQKTQNFSDFAICSNWRSYRWDELVNDIRKIIGRNRLVVLPFSLKSGGCESFFRSFCAALDIRLPENLKTPTFTHKSWNRKKIEIARQVSPLLTWDEFREFDKFLATSAIGEGERHEPFVTDSMRNEILSYHIKGNEGLFRVALRGQDMKALGFLPD